MIWTPLDKETFELAAAIIEAHGRDAIRRAAIHAYECDRAGDAEGAKTWDLVMHAIVELTRSSQRVGELCN